MKGKEENGIKVEFVKTEIIRALEIPAERGEANQTTVSIMLGNGKLVLGEGVAVEGMLLGQADGCEPVFLKFAGAVRPPDFYWVWKTYQPVPPVVFTEVTLGIHRLDDWAGKTVVLPVCWSVTTTWLSVVYTENQIRVAKSWPYPAFQPGCLFLVGKKDRTVTPRSGGCSFS